MNNEFINPSIGVNNGVNNEELASIKELIKANNSLLEEIKNALEKEINNTNKLLNNNDLEETLEPVKEELEIPSIPSEETKEEVEEIIPMDELLTSSEVDEPVKEEKETTLEPNINTVNPIEENIQIEEPKVEAIPQVEAPAEENNIPEIPVINEEVKIPVAEEKTEVIEPKVETIPLVETPVADNNTKETINVVSSPAVPTESKENNVDILSQVAPVEEVTSEVNTSPEVKQENEIEILDINLDSAKTINGGHRSIEVSQAEQEILGGNNNLQNNNVLTLAA